MSAPAELLRDFVNTYDVEGAADELASPAELTLWLRERGLVGPADRALDHDLELAVRLREGLRLVLHHNPGQRAPEELERALTALPLRVTLTPGVPGLEPIAPGVTGGLARIAALIAASHADGTWPRLKVCVESGCQWAFIDSSKNRSRAWCSMRVCGNRTKTRTYRARRQAEGSATSA
ncbi:CGNR zinc finger domain-containing protein [Acrocarpospora catenulata]|uniref:CGNR zinc finger domain-containing protein n=1 Tax=Acrocarpospora catenulata TaxID=2836182 RepID=UPI001BDA4098|nr:CGNR zinc finger domain-containing protein [Acrocarpospora catenulata]